MVFDKNITFNVIPKIGSFKSNGYTEEEIKFNNELIGTQKNSISVYENNLNDKVQNLDNYLIISNKKYSVTDSQLVLDNIPINIFKLVEKINIEFLKIQLKHFTGRGEWI